MSVVTARWQAVAALVDPVRRALYHHVRSQDHPVTREEAATAQRISRSLAAHHLDKLVEADLLRARYQHPPGEPRSRGRAPKVYEPAEDGVALTIPERRYELAGQILADAVAEAPDDAHTAANAIAERVGRRLGRQAAESAGESAGTDGPADRTADGTRAEVTRVLADLGFSPSRPAPDRLLLDNCPFHALARRQPELVCGLNHALLRGLLAGLDRPDLTAHLAPRPGACCVQISRRR